VRALQAINLFALRRYEQSEANPSTGPGELREHRRP
jgi:hypothetical protein